MYVALEFVIEDDIMLFVYVREITHTVNDSQRPLTEARFAWHKDQHQTKVHGDDK